MTDVNSGDKFEIKKLKELEILDSTLLSNISTTREHFQQLIGAKKNLLLNYAEYIIFERKILSFVADAEEKHGDQIADLKASLIKRVCRLFRTAIRNFEDNLQFRTAYASFIKKYKPQETSAMYEEMLQKHSEEIIWCDYAIWTHEHKENLAAAKQVISSAFQHHPNSEMINAAKFRILILEVYLKKSCVGSRDIVSIRLKEALEWYKECKEFRSYKLLVEFLLICEEENYKNITPAFQKMIIDDLKDMFPLQEYVYDVLAQRELRGYSEMDIKNLSAKDVINADKFCLHPFASNSSKNEEASDSNYRIWQKRPFETRLTLCRNKYEQGFEIIKTPQMLNYYINCMQRIMEDDMLSDKNLKWTSYIKTFKLGHKAQIMNCEQYCNFFKVLFKCDNVRKSGLGEKILSELPKHLKNRLDVYNVFINHYIEENNNNKILEIFSIAREKLLPKQALPILKQLILHYENNENDKHRILQSIFKDAIRVECSDYLQFRIQYLNFCSTHKNIDQTRTEYDYMVDSKPPYLELHRRMAIIEGQQSKPNIHRWRSCFENAVRFFGSLNAEVWNEYIEFEKGVGDISRISNIQNKMFSTLDDAHVNLEAHDI